MATLNQRARNTRRTHEGAMAAVITPEQELRRSVMACLLRESQFYENGEDIATRISRLCQKVKPDVMACLLRESQFYENGEDIATRISRLCQKVKPDVVADIAREARTEQNLRHVPLLLARELARQSWHGTADLLYDIIQRPDELTEFVAIYEKNGREKWSAQVKKGLARAFTKFDAYQLAKYNRKKVVTLPLVMRLSHAKPKDDEQRQIWKQLLDGTLPAPDTWEVALSSGADKKEAWTRLLAENKLGALALLRNLRNMEKAGVEADLIRLGLGKSNVLRVLPFRFIAAARYAPYLEPELEQAMFRSISGRLNGRTIVLVDGSGSMGAALSERSEMTRFDAACGVAMIAREMCEDVRVFVFSNNVFEVAPRRGFALRDAITAKAEFGSTNLGRAVIALNEKYLPYRLIVVTDEQSHDRVAEPKNLGYMINVASYENGVGYGRWVHVDGWSDAVFKYILASESEER